jgi:beta-glucosidase-like glycosyl hydrolase
VGLTGYGPNINMVKDPRYGRNSELPGEDPFLTGTYAQHYVQGMQQWSTGAHPHLKMVAYLKHYTAYVPPFPGFVSSETRGSIAHIFNLRSHISLVDAHKLSLESS